MFGEGISQEGCIIDTGVQYEIIQKSGSFFSYNGNKVAQGREKMRIVLKENAEVRAEIEQRIRDAARGKTVDERESTDAE